MARHRLLPFLLCTAWILSLPIQAQAQDAKKPHSAKKAAIMSACLPGLGQVYNGKWWKVPIVYAGLGGLGYMAYDNRASYKTFLTAYKIKTGDLEEGVVPSEAAQQLAEYYQAGQLQSYKDSYRRDFELFCILTAAWYGLNIVDATVDGHLYTYDISDDLSLTVDPVFTAPESPCLAYAGKPQTGVILTLHF
ncbi:MAG: hypothetical protein J5831_01365 [Bacteroidales bacterium]|nr:hypothetical protein [Bacteroidales bacterium]